MRRGHITDQYFPFTLALLSSTPTKFSVAGAGAGAHLNNNLVIISTLGIVILFLHQGETLVNYTEYNSLDNDNKIHFPRFIISPRCGMICQQEWNFSWSGVGLAQF